MSNITIAFIISLIVIIFTIVNVKRSSLNHDLKIALYAITIFIPVAGLILFYVFKIKNKRERERVETQNHK